MSTQLFGLLNWDFIIVSLRVDIFTLEGKELPKARTY